jgi:hypothetical protein
MRGRTLRRLKTERASCSSERNSVSSPVICRRDAQKAPPPKLEEPLDVALLDSSS